MDRMLARKPLLAAETKAAPATVCVTGATSYVGASIVARLLAAGHTVHATCRRPDDPVAASLKELAPAKRLQWFKADLLDDGSFDAAFQGCKYVIHTACPVVASVSPKEEFSKVIGPAIIGVKNVLGSVNRTPSVKKVVMTSSVAAVHEFQVPAGHVYRDSDFNLEFPVQATAYNTAKTLAELEAWAIAGQQDNWQLVTICPGLIYGPPVVPNYKSESVQSLLTLVDGRSWPFAPSIGFFTVDLDDVAAAHVLAMSLPAAHGRYVLSERGANIADIAAKLRAWYPAHRVPPLTLPHRLILGILKLTRQVGTYNFVKSECYKHRMDCSKARAELGLEFIPLEQTLRDMVDGMMAHGVVKRQ